MIKLISNFLFFRMTQMEIRAARLAFYVARLQYAPTTLSSMIHSLVKDYRPFLLLGAPTAKRQQDDLK